MIDFVARQLELDPGQLAGYGSRRATRSVHVAVVCRHLGLGSIGGVEEARLVAFLGAKASQMGDVGALREAAEEWVIREGLLRPTEAFVERLVAHARAAAEVRLFAHVSAQLSDGRRFALDALCEVDESGDSPLAALRAPPRAPSAASKATRSLWATSAGHEVSRSISASDSDRVGIAV